MEAGIRFIGSTDGKRAVIALTCLTVLIIEVIYRYLLASSVNMGVTNFITVIAAVLITSVGDDDKERVALRLSLSALKVTALYTLISLPVGSILEQLLTGSVEEPPLQSYSIRISVLTPPFLFLVTSIIFCICSALSLLWKKFFR